DSHGGHLLRMMGIGVEGSRSTAGAPLDPASLPASDSSTARSRGSAIRRRPSPSSVGTGPAEGRWTLTFGRGARPWLKAVLLIASLPNKRLPPPLSNRTGWFLTG